MNFRTSLYRFFARLPRRFRGRKRILAAIVVALGIGMYALFFSAPFDFPTGGYVHIGTGSLSASAQTLQEKNVIRSQFLFKALSYLLGGEHHAVAGTYFFPARSNVLSVAERIKNGDFEVTPTRVRIPEGVTVEEITKILAKNIPDFNVVEFTRAARGKEGYLFPDTYFFMPGQGTTAILGAFDNNFNTHIAKIQDQIKAFGKPLAEVLVMASLLEREAPNTDDRRVIAGILWKRISLGMPLQVDAVFPYIIGKNSFTLTTSDLKTDSPYNTYTHKGLPPGPIANPGIDAILAAVTPVQTSYLFYLSDLHGNIHYSVTYDQHLVAKNRYIDNN